MRLFRTILSFLLAGLVFVSATTFTMSTHVCMGHINAVAFLDKADGCGHAYMPPCHQALMKGCCEDKVVKHDGQDFQDAGGKIKVYEGNGYIVAYVLPTIIAYLTPLTETELHAFSLYDPPWPAPDRVVMTHSFLI